ncbi:hypothetical protein N7489_000318 [Penicillium chrysogenum]|uniref:uncharacterized protein n=1 Tax=Penicillium chrysogenum TaxID=5076 RepID=UPI0024DF0E00|nr:uncharacterized protein N7489_000318 [Penicillium chrysogenum]KAJ5249908.1 hypothetical protein N7489_000318 [Penicillium chrysogenum]KAJ6148475.1 hypothetical protein N7497_010457 [Penicillium chrysogenum]
MAKTKYTYVAGRYGTAIEGGKATLDFPDQISKWVVQTPRDPRFSSFQECHATNSENRGFGGAFNPRTRWGIKSNGSRQSVPVRGDAVQEFRHQDVGSY